MTIGGKREGSGRPRGSSKYKEETKPIRIPLSLIPLITLLLSYIEKGVKSHDLEEKFTGARHQKNCINPIKRIKNKIA